jgi:signal transduction histidine kinase
MVSSAAISSTHSRSLHAPADLPSSYPLDGDPGLQTVSQVVHDLRSPLSSILLLAETLYRRHHQTGDAIAQRQAGLIYGAALAMHGLVSSVRDLARGAHTLIDPEPVRFPVGGCIETISALVRPLAEEKGLAFRVVVPQRFTLIGHPTALTRVLLNLVTNGLKFTDRGYVEIVGTTLDDGGARFVVRDTGTGLPESVALLVNNGASLAIDRAAASVGGEDCTGLGLLLCVRLARLMSGTLRVDRTGADGTCFVLDLPLAVPRDDDALAGDYSFRLT